MLRAGRVSPDEPSPEAKQVLQLCRAGPRSVAEIAATLGLPVQVTKIILSDLIDCGALSFVVPTITSGDPASDPQLLEAVLAGLRAYAQGR